MQVTDSPYKHLIGGARQAVEDPAAPRLARFRPVGALPSIAWVTLSNPQYQESASSCLAHAVEFALASDVKARTGAHVAVSRMDLYYGARVLAGDWPNDVGSYPHLAERWLAERGTLPEVLAPYDATKVTTWKPDPSWAARRAAWTADLEKMPADVDQIRAELATDRCVIVCHNVDRQMAGIGPGQAGRTGLEVGMTGGTLGGHARCFAGYDDTVASFLCVNWWRGWGVQHPMSPVDARFAAWDDSCSWVPYTVAVDPGWQFDYRRIAKGLEVKT